MYGTRERRRCRVVIEWLSYGAESRRKVAGSRLGLSIRGLENSVKPAVNGYLFSNWGRMGQRKERDGLRLSFALPKIQWHTNPNCPLLGYGTPLPLPSMVLE